MTDHGRRVAALAAVFAPARAGALLGRMTDDGAEALTAAAALAAAPRRERLRTLAGALSVDPAERRARAESAAAEERPRVAALLRQLASDACAPAASPALLRLCRERLGR